MSRRCIALPRLAMSVLADQNLQQLFFSQICADSLFTCGGRTLQEQNHAVMGIISIALRSSALPRRLWGRGCPTGPGSAALCWARGFSLRGCSHWDLLKSKYKINPFPSCGLLFLMLLVKLICQRCYWIFFFMQVG